MSLPAPKNEPVEAPMSIDDHKPDTVATPEGDNEYSPDAPLHPIDGLETPTGNAPNSYDTDKPDAKAEKPSGIEKFIDEVARGEYM